jgi:uncharacterized protein (DUF169 family)
MAAFMQNLNQWRDTLRKLNFKFAPMAIKYCASQPKGIERLDRKLAFCEMIRYAQIGNAFYVHREDHTCPVGPLVTGGPAPGAAFETGLFGEAIGANNAARAMRRHYDRLPKLAKDSIKCVAFSPLDQLVFEPDLLVLIGDNVEQTDILLRALTYKNGGLYESKSSYVLACAWLYIYPYLTGEWNFVTTGFSMGLATRKIYPPGLQIISVPYDRLPMLLENLNDMPWVLPIYGVNAKEHHDRLCADLGIPDEPPPYFWEHG